MDDDSMPAKCQHCGQEQSGDAWVPKTRLDKAIKARDEAAAAAKLAEEAHAAKLAEVEAQVAAAASVPDLQAQIATLTGERDGLVLRGQVMSAGLTDAEGIDLALLAWGRVAEDARPPGGLSEWLTSPAAPRGVRAYLPQAAAPKPAESGKAAAPVVPHQPSAQAGLTAEQIRALTPEQYLAHRASLASQLRGG